MKEMKLHSNILTVRNNSKHYSVQRAGRCNTTIHKFTGDRTANTKRGNQYRLPFQAFNVMFCSRYSSGGADQLVLSTVLGTSHNATSPVSGKTEHEMLLSG